MAPLRVQTDERSVMMRGPRERAPHRHVEFILQRFLLLLLSIVAVVAQAGPLPYDESVDAKAAVQQAIGGAGVDHRPVLVIFGANWCDDCRALDLSLKTGRNAELIAGEFRVVKVDVGRFDRNLDIDKAYGHPIGRGIPAAVVLSADNRVLYATKAGELANARRMSDTGIYSFFEGVVRSAHDRDRQ